MKKSILSTLALAALLFVSCNEEETISNDLVEFSGGSTLTGIITENVILDASVDYELPAQLVIAQGGQLTIPAGTTISATGGTSSYIAVSRGGQIYVNGESGNPVVMTSGEETPAAGDWGGLVICGNAPSNLGDDVLSEVGNLTYGGDDTEDNSGSITHLRIEYTGALFNASKEFNGVSFFGVGSGTTVNNILAYESGDDGIEFFGGTVNAENIAVINAYDDSVDAADGFSGTVENIYIYGVTKAGLEVSNNGDDESRTPETNSTFNNITVVKAEGFSGSEFVVNYKEGGGSQTYTNLVFSGFDTFAKFSSDDTTAANVAADKFVVNSYYTDGTELSDAEGILEGLTNDNTLTGAGNGLLEPTWVADLK